MRSSFLSLVSAFILAACAASLPYANDYPLTDRQVVFQDGSISGWIPQGWLVSQDDSLDTVLQAWLVAEDFSATMGVRELMLDRLSSARVQSEGMQLLASLTIAMRGDSSLKGVEVRDFELQGRRCTGYEITDMEGKRQRIVVFTAKEKFYECSLLTSQHATTKQLALLFSAQQTFLSTLTF